MKTIDITTTQKVTIEYELAGLRDRFLAHLIDLMVVGAVWLIIYIFFSMAFYDDFRMDDNGMGETVYYFLLMFTFLLYHFLSELLMDGQSVGKKAVGTKVIKLNGKQASASDYFLRALFHFIDTIMSIQTLGALMIVSTDKNQRLGDLAANTAVIRVKFNLRFRLEDIMKINSLANYEPKFPDVRQFTEQDMLLIKSVVARNRMFRNPAHREALNNLVRDLMLKLDIVDPPKDRIKFLKTLIKDYIVLTR